MSATLELSYPESDLENIKNIAQRIYNDRRTAFDPDIDDKSWKDYRAEAIAEIGLFKKWDGPISGGYFDVLDESTSTVYYHCRLSADVLSTVRGIDSRAWTMEDAPMIRESFHHPDDVPLSHRFAVLNY